MEALNETVCSENNEPVPKEPSTVVFNCTYELPMESTTYTWYMDGQPQSQFNGSVANIFIQSGSHTVTCKAFIDASDGSFNENCTCTESRTINVTVVGM